MNYLRQYDLLVESRLSLGRVKSKGCCLESHHIIPRCMGGQDGRMVLLTSKEHYIAHHLLHRAYPKDRGLSLAFWWMCHGSRLCKRDRRITSRSFAEARVSMVEAQMGNKYGLGKVCSEEKKEKLRIKRKDFKHSNESKEKIGMASRGRVASDETRMKLSNMRIGHSVSEETKEKLRIANTGKKLSEEHIRKLRISHLGNKSGLGYKHTEEEKKKMSLMASRKRKPLSDETKRRISLALLRRGGVKAV